MKDYPKIYCLRCRKGVEIPVSYEKFYAIRNRRFTGKSIQDIAPLLSPSLREMFITGICEDCWNKEFGEEE